MSNIHMLHKRTLEIGEAVRARDEMAAASDQGKQRLFIKDDDCMSWDGSFSNFLENHLPDMIYTYFPL